MFYVGSMSDNYFCWLKVVVMKIVGWAFCVLLLSVVLILYLSRDRLVENLDAGLQGPRGIAGPQGAKGDKGDKGDTGGSFEWSGRLGNIGCLTGDDGESGMCYAEYNRLGGDIGLQKKGYGTEQMWKLLSDGKLKNMAAGQCLGVQKNDGVGSDKVVFEDCDKATGWSYNDDGRLVPNDVTNDWALATFNCDGGNGQCLTIASSSSGDASQQWTTL